MHPVSQLFAPSAFAAGGSELDMRSLQAILAQLRLSDPHCAEGLVVVAEDSPVSALPVSEDRVGSDTDSSGGTAGSVTESRTSGQSPTSQQSKRSMRRKRHQENKRRMAEASMQVAQHEENAQYKTRLCAEWESMGICHAGDACHFAHGAQELRTEFDNQSAVTCLAKLMGKFSKAQRAQGRPQRPALPAQPVHTEIAMSTSSLPAPDPRQTPVGESPVMPIALGQSLTSHSMINHHVMSSQLNNIRTIQATATRAAPHVPVSVIHVGRPSVAPLWPLGFAPGAPSFHSFQPL